MSGFLFSFEGIDGVGKTTQVGLVKNWLEQLGYPVRVVREPGGTELGERIREIILYGQTIAEPNAEFLLFAAARAELVGRVIRPVLQAGGVVLADRYTDSSEVYQGFGRGADFSLIAQVNAAITAEAIPQGTLWLDGTSRREGASDNLESRDDRFFERVRQGYRSLAEHHPERFVRIQADQSREAVFESIQQAISGWLGKGSKSWLREEGERHNSLKMPPEQ